MLLSMKMCYFLFQKLLLLFTVVLLKSNPINTILSCFFFCISFIFRTHVCIDQQGNDPFEKLRNIVGKTVESTIEYNENTVMFEYGNTTLYTRVNDDGCNVIPTTLPPTLPPTTLPPTTLPPTTLPPTTLPPTQPPTVPPTESPKPHHNYTVWFIIGAVCIVIGFIIIFVIVCKKNKQAADTEETKPLV